MYPAQSYQITLFYNTIIVMYLSFLVQCSTHRADDVNPLWAVENL